MTKELQKNENKELAIVVPDGFNEFDDQEKEIESESGMNYLSEHYRYLIKQNMNEFQIVDMKEEDKICGTKETLENAILFHSHRVYRLHRGILDGNLDEKTWTKEDREILAVAYRDPRGRNYKSRGSFDPSYSEWIDNIDLYKKLKVRCYCYFMYEQTLFSATFGRTASISINELAKRFKQIKSGENKYGVPLPSIYVNFSFETDESKDGKSYFRIVCNPVYKGNNYSWTTKDITEYRNKIFPIMFNVKKWHQDIIDSTENVVSVSNNFENEKVIKNPGIDNNDKDQTMFNMK
jgi:hypothetical protein